MKANHIFLLTGISIALVIIYNAYQRRRKDVPVFIRKRLINNYNARTIPPFGVFITESQKDNKDLHKHEKTHWIQYQKKGLLNYYADYATELNKYGYDKMPMEQEARLGESDYCKENYTDCVRNGSSNTVFNPIFRK